MVGMSARYCSEDNSDVLLVQLQHCLECSATSCFISAGSVIVVQVTFAKCVYRSFLLLVTLKFRVHFAGNSSSTWITERERTKAPSFLFSVNRLSSSISELTFWYSAMPRRFRIGSFLASLSNPALP